MCKKLCYVELHETQSNTIYDVEHIANIYYKIVWANLVEVEHQIKFTHIVEVFIEHFNKVMNCLQVAEIIVIYINADAEVQSCISSVHNFKVAKLEE